MPEVKYRVQGGQIRFREDAVKLRLGGFWVVASNRVVTRSDFEQLKADNPRVEFVADDGIEAIGPGWDLTDRLT